MKYTSDFSVSIEVAYKAVILFLEQHREFLETDSENIRVLLSGMVFRRSKQTDDPAMWDDWCLAINQVLENPEADIFGNLS